MPNLISNPFSVTSNLLFSSSFKALSLLESNGLHSHDKKVATTAAVRILKAVGLYGAKGTKTVGLPKTPEEAVWS